jgi:hypothetical protein
MEKLKQACIAALSTFGTIIIVLSAGLWLYGPVGNFSCTGLWSGDSCHSEQALPLLLAYEHLLVAVIVLSSGGITYLQLSPGKGHVLAAAALTGFGSALAIGLPLRRVDLMATTLVIALPMVVWLAGRLRVRASA